MPHNPMSKCAHHGLFVGVSCAECSHSGSAIDRADPGRCAQHGKDQSQDSSKDNIFICLNCSVCICVDCVCKGKAHALHHVDNLAIVYEEKLSEVEQNLAKVETSILSMQPATAVYARNLETLENEEASAVKRIEGLAEASKQQLWNLTTNRKATLRDKLQIAVQKDKLLAELREDVKKLSAEQLFQQRSTIDLKCSNLMAGCATVNVALEAVDDLQCDMIPPYWFKKLTFLGFTGTVGKSYSYTTNSTCDVLWDIVITKSSKLLVQLTPRDAKIGTFRHKVVVLIPHSNFRATFEVEGISNTLELAEASQLKGNAKGDLEVSVGIHPIDAVVEKGLLYYQYQKLKAKSASTEQQLAAITNGFDYKYHIMNFKVYIWKLEMEEEWYSYSIVDDDNRHWCLYLQPASDYHYQIFMLEAYILLQRGTATNCRFFIQMLHENSGQSILKTMTSFFYQDDYNGFDHFITWKALVDDEGFYPDDNLRFRFGVRPLQAGE